MGFARARPILRRGAAMPASARLAHPDKTLPALQALPGHFAVEVVDPLRFGDKIVIGLLGEFGLQLERLVEGPHAPELLEEGRGLVERAAGEVAIGIRDGLVA